MGQLKKIIPVKKLILVRHAHRIKTLGGAGDDGISLKGQLQAKKIRRQLKKLWPAGPFILLSSPKRRCIETLMPLAEKWGLDIQINLLLGEGGDTPRKIEAFIEWWQAEAALYVIACSHGDWIPKCVEKLTGARCEVRKGSWLEIHDNGQSITLDEFRNARSGN